MNEVESQAPALAERFVYSKWVTALVAIVAVMGLVGWFARHEPFLGPIRIATGIQGGQYDRFGQAIGKHLEKSAKRKVEVIHTEGSLENRRMLLDGEVHLALFAHGVAPLDSLTAIAPLYRSISHVVVRDSSDIHSITDLDGKNLTIGPVASGYYRNALAILNHYGVTPGNNSERHFSELAEDKELDAAIVTTWFFNYNLR